MNKQIKLKINKNEIIFYLIIYIIIVIYLLYFSPLCGRSLNKRTIQFIPFKTVFDQFNIKFGIDIFLGNILGNLIMLMPLGFFIGILGFKLSFKRVIIFFISTSLFIELMQFILAVGCMDIDDIWMNALGGIIGYRLSRRYL